MPEIQCPCCGSGEHEVISRTEITDTGAGAVRRFWAVVRCRQCGALWNVNPYPEGPGPG